MLIFGTPGIAIAIAIVISSCGNSDSAGTGAGGSRGPLGGSGDAAGRSGTVTGSAVSTGVASGGAANTAGGKGRTSGEGDTTVSSGAQGRGGASGTRGATVNRGGGVSEDVDGGRAGSGSGGRTVGVGSGGRTGGAGNRGIGGTAGRAIGDTGGAPPQGTGGGGASDAGGADAGGADAGKRALSTCTSSSTWKAGDNKATLQFGGRTRSYVVYVPSSIQSGTAVPLVFDFHGHGGSSTQEESSSGWKKKADQAGFIVIYPDGVDSSWNVGNCCGQAMSENVDDVGFTRAMIEAVGKAACIDPKRIYATGMSNGAGFVHRLGCEAADVIAAIAAASADLVTDPCQPARPISELSVRGLSDSLVAYGGGKTGSTGWYSPGAEETLDLWRQVDQCTGSKSTTHQYCESYTSCSAGVEVTLCSLPNTGHDTYNNAVGLSVPDLAWEMFQRQPMP